MSLIITHGEVPANHMRSFARIMEREESTIVTAEQIYENVPKVGVPFDNPSDSHRHEDIVAENRYQKTRADEIAKYLAKAHDFAIIRDWVDLVIPFDEADLEVGRHFTGVFQYLGHVSTWGYRPFMGAQPASMKQGHYDLFSTSSMLRDEHVGGALVLSRNVSFGANVTKTEKIRSIIEGGTLTMTPSAVMQETTYVSGFSPEVTPLAREELSRIAADRNAEFQRCYDQDPTWNYGIDNPTEPWDSEEAVVYNKLG